MIPLVDKEKCTGCGSCIEICPPQALSFQKETVYIDDDLCEECGFCVAECPVEAISLPFPLSCK
jgi:ferredoxin